MFQNPRDYFIQNARPTYAEFFEKRLENQLGVSNLVRLGVNATIALYHMHEHLSPTPSVASLVKACPDYALVRDVTNATKHKKLTRPAKPPAQISSAEQVFEAGIVTVYQDEQGTYSHAQAEVLVKLDNGAHRKLAEILHNVMTMWCAELKAQGVGDFKHPEAPIVDAHVTRADAEARRMPMVLNKGEDWKQRMIVQRFDYANNAVVPVPITDAEFIIHPEHMSARIGMTVVAGEPPTDFDVPLTLDQYRTYAKLPPEEQIQYVARIVEGTTELQRALFEKYAAEHPHLGLIVAERK